jgi:hypothetical protein
VCAVTITITAGIIAEAKSEDGFSAHIVKKRLSRTRKLKIRWRKQRGRKIIMKNRSLLILGLVALIGITSFVIARARGQQQAEKQFALLMKATGPEFFKKVEEPDGKQLVEKHFKKLQALTAQGVCIFSGHSLNTDESGFGIIVVRVDS